MRGNRQEFLQHRIDHGWFAEQCASDTVERKHRSRPGHSQRHHRNHCAGKCTANIRYRFNDVPECGQLVRTRSHRFQWRYVQFVALQWPFNARITGQPIAIVHWLAIFVVDVGIIAIAIVIVGIVGWHDAQHLRLFVAATPIAHVVDTSAAQRQPMAGHQTAEICVPEMWEHFHAHWGPRTSPTAARSKANAVSTVSEGFLACQQFAAPPRAPQSEVSLHLWFLWASICQFDGAHRAPEDSFGHAGGLQQSDHHVCARVRGVPV